MNKIQTVDVSGLETHLGERHEVVYTLTSALLGEAVFALLCKWEEEGTIVVEEVVG